MRARPPSVLDFEAGFGAGQQYPAPPEITLDVPPEPWTVSNAGGQDYGTLTLVDATVNSVNTVYAQVLAQIGPEAVADMAERLGIGRELEAQPAIALGTEEVSPLELATVFSTFSRSGERIDPYTITSVETTDGATLWKAEVEAEEVVEPGIADTVSAILAETPRRGTATRAALDRPMAAKTGTTQRNADAWLAGYTPQYTAVVWMGYADGNRPMDTVDGTGYEVCVNGWQAALEGPATAESPPDGGSTESRRSAELTVPAGAPPGEYQVVARCDFGTGPRPYGPPATLQVGPEPTTTTSSTTSTTEPAENGRGNDDDGPPGQETTTTSTTTTSTSAPAEDDEEATAGA